MVTENFPDGQIIYLPSLYPSLKQILAQALPLALAQVFYDFPPLTFYGSVKNLSGFSYLSPLALQLSQGNLSNVISITPTISSCLAASFSSPDALAVYVCLTPQGLMDFYFPSSTLGVWLEGLPLVLPPYLGHLCLNLAPQEVFLRQYLINRCQSLLDLAAREKLLTLSVTNAPFSWPIQSPSPLPWHKADAPTELLTQIILALDALETPQAQGFLSSLATALLNFERRYRIFGEVAKNNPELAQTRLGLLALAQILLKKSLEVG